MTNESWTLNEPACRDNKSNSTKIGRHFNKNK